VELKSESYFFGRWKLGTGVSRSLNTCFVTGNGQSRWYTQWWSWARQWQRPPAIARRTVYLVGPSSACRRESVPELTRFCGIKLTFYLNLRRDNQDENPATIRMRIPRQSG
jgi:hypothetical protein